MAITLLEIGYNIILSTFFNRIERKNVNYNIDGKQQFYSTLTHVRRNKFH